MKRISIVLLIAILTSSGIYAQKGKTYEWSAELKEKGLLQIVGGDESGVIALRQYNDYGQRTDRLELIKYDNDLKEKYIVELRDLETFYYEDVSTIDSPEGIAHIYYVTTEDGRRMMSAQLFDKKTLAKGDIVDFAFFSVYKNGQESFYFDRENIPQYPINLYFSDDKTLMAVTYLQEKVGKSDIMTIQYAVVDLMNGFGLVQEGELETDYKSNRYDVSDVHLSNSGKLSIILKTFDNDDNEEFVNRRPAYNYELHHMSSDSSGYIYDIKIRENFMDRLMVTSDSRDNLYIVGLERDKPYGKSTKSYILGLDPIGDRRFLTREKYSRRDLKEIHRKEKDKLDDDYETVDLKMSEDILYVIRQDRSMNTTTRDDNSFAGRRNRRFYGGNQFITENYWNWEQVIVEGIGKETGERQWLTINPRKHEEQIEFDRYFMRGWTKVVDNNLYFIYNERSENLERIRRKEKLKETDLPGDKTAPLIVRINDNGEIKYRETQGESNYYVPRNGIRILGDYIYTVAQKRNYKNYIVGRLPQSILDF